MMEYDRYASAVRADYALFAANLTNRYLTARLGQKVGPRTVHEFRLHALVDTVTFGNSVAERAKAYLLALGQSGNTEVAANHFLTLHAIADKNAQDLGVRLMGGSDTRVANLLNREAGAIGQLLQRHAQRVGLTAQDRAGRTWQADKLVSLLARKFAYDAFIDAQAHHIESVQGYDLAEVVYPDPTHHEHGTLVSLSGDDSDFPAFAGVRDRIFHPNSTAQLRAYVPA